MTIQDQKLLIVEDEEELVEILKIGLGKICNNILTAPNGKVALDLIDKNPDLCAILSDVNMPLMSGLELLAEIRSKFNPVPFVILTSHVIDANYRDAIRLNATDFLAKPFDMQQVRDVMDKALRYGIELQKIDAEINQLTSSIKDMSPEKLEAMKRARRTVMAMRVEGSIYIKK